MIKTDIVAMIAEIEPGSPLAAVVAGRADVMALTQKAHDGALTPQEPGGLSHAERAALACRIAKINGDKAFEEHFERLLDKVESQDDAAHMADIYFSGNKPRDRALIRHVDLVAHSPREATRRDIELLREAGIVDADIVRLAELVAFVSYQIRVAAGLRLMGALA
jgi:uncharacterized protein YciW